MAQAFATHGVKSYIETAHALAARTGASWTVVLARILAVKAISGMSAFEYGLYGLHREPLSKVRDYRTKKQTTALFERINVPERRSMVDDKLLFRRLCQKAGLACPEVLAVLTHQPASHDGPERLFASFSDLMRAYERASRLDLILKPRTDSLGTGVRFVSLRSGRAFDMDDRPLDLAGFWQALSEDMRRDQYLVQPFVRPHPDIAALGAGKALGTLRILALSTSPGMQILYALMRIPARGNVHDNFSSGANGNLIASVDATTGLLSSAWGCQRHTRSRLLQRYASNPDTGARIEGVRIPMWQEVLGLIESATYAFRELPCLGWDIAVTADGPTIIEANANPDIIGAQVCCGMGARRLLGPLSLANQASPYVRS